MYIVNIINGNRTIEIHGANEKLKTGNVVQGINSIDSFSCSMLPSNKGFYQIHDMKTLVTVYNTHKKRYEFRGRVLYSFDNMDESGLITKEITCESLFGFFNDSRQKYVAEQNWTVLGLLEHIISTHNSKVEECKQFTIGEVTVTDPNDNLYLGIQRETTWKTIEEKLINQLGGEIRFRVADEITYIDYLEEIGSTKTTEIKLSKNMKKISREKDPSSYITRLIPYGCKLTAEQTTTDEEGNEITEEVETEERLDITSVNDGIEYIEDADAIERFGIIEGIVEFDDVTEPSNLFSKGENYLINNNKMLVKYSITALDLSLLGLAIDDFEVCNWHPVINKLLGIDDIVRIIKKNIDVVNNDAFSSIEIGDNFKTLTDMQIEQDGKLNEAINTIVKIDSDYVTNQKLTSESLKLYSLIKQTSDAIKLMVEENYLSSSSYEEFKQTLKTDFEVWSSGIVGRVTRTETNISNTNCDLQELTNTITKYFTFTINGLTIGQENNPNKVIIDNDDINIVVNGVVVLRLDSEGKALIPELKVTRKFNVLGIIGEETETTIDFAYITDTSDPLIIVTNPENQTVTAGQTAKFTIIVMGEDVKYQWQYSADSSMWVDSVTTNDYSITTSEDAEAYTLYVRCTVTDKEGNEKTSNVAVLTVEEAPEEDNDTGGEA